MKVVYFGTDVFLSCFEYFLREHEVLALYTYHNDEDYFTEHAIVKRAGACGIPIHYEAITQEEILRFFDKESCGLLFSAEYDRRIPVPEDFPSFRGINVHSSLLPQGRSYYPIEAAMDRGLARSGVTLHKLAPRLDQGDILAQRIVENLQEKDSIDVYLSCAAYAREMTEEIMQNLEGYWKQAMVQKEKFPYWKRPEDEHLTIAHTMTGAQARAVFRKYNSMTQVQLDDAWYYVTGMDVGTVMPEEGERWISPVRLLYRVQDGHLRLDVRKKEGEEG